ncbi:hypothetical protein EDB85DRAFT_809712 [Lactarius pseudohatsudake]|nr:hypothetical protein EDB85DRAFT_809712 [Lactarius pseudohatsudake]
MHPNTLPRQWSVSLLAYNALLDSASTNDELHVLRVSRADGEGEGDHVIRGEHFLVDVVSEAGQRKGLPLQARATPLARPCIAGDAACRARRIDAFATALVRPEHLRLTSSSSLALSLLHKRRSSRSFRRSSVAGRTTCTPGSQCMPTGELGT